MAAPAQPAAPAMNDNPLLTESNLPLGYPRFDAIRTEHFAPAFERGMAEQRKEIEAIAKNPDKPSFENTIVALERSGLPLWKLRWWQKRLSDELSPPAPVGSVAPVRIVESSPSRPPHFEILTPSGFRIV